MLLNRDGSLDPRRDRGFAFPGTRGPERRHRSDGRMVHLQRRNDLAQATETRTSCNPLRQFQSLLPLLVARSNVAPPLPPLPTQAREPPLILRVFPPPPPPTRKFKLPLLGRKFLPPLLLLFLM